MGSESKAKQKPRRHLKRSGNTKPSEVDNLPQQKEHPSQLNLSSLPSCVQKLQSTEWAELEEACRDICYFALKPQHHTNFVQAKVPVRLAQLLFSPSPLLNSEGSQLSTLSLHRDVIYMQLAAAETLRNLITNSQEDEVLDLLTSSNLSENNGGVTSALLPPITDFSRLIGGLLQNVYAWMKEAHQNINPQDWMDDNDGEGNENEGDADNDENDTVDLPENVDQGGFAPSPQIQNKRRRDNQSSNYLLLLAFLDEILRLLTVCLEVTTTSTTDSTATLNKGDRCMEITEVFSQPEALHLLLEILDGSVNTTWENLLHPAGYFSDPISSSQGAFVGQDNGVAHPDVQSSEAHSMNPMLQALRSFKQEETKRLASIASATADVLYSLSPDNPTMAAFLVHDGDGAGVSPARPHISPSQQSFLNQVVDAVQLRGWWAAASEDPLATPLALTAQGVYCELMRMTVAVQGTLLHASPRAETMRGVLPTLAGVLGGALPVRLWRTTLPLLLAGDAAGADEAHRAAGVALATARLRVGLAAMRVFQGLVEVLCAGNPPGLDDDDAFARNPHGGLLRESGTLAAFGLLLRDVLWLAPDAPSHGPPSQDVLSQAPFSHSPPSHDVTEQRARDLLRAAAPANAAVTTLQFLMLSMEVGVWATASLLLLMVPVASLGDPGRVWAAVRRAVEHRYGLLLDAAATAAQGGPDEDENAGGARTIAAASASARQLLWLQLESLTQMLWTLQRKQARAQGGVLLTTNAQLRAETSEVDLLVRLAWERREGRPGGHRSAAGVMPSLTQACVGTVGLLCASFREFEATVVGARFALAILTSYGREGSAAPTSSSTLLQLDGEVLLSGTRLLANPAERRAWLQRLFTVDGIVSARAEAANTLMDFFLDERYDKEVYVPEGIHKSLSNFLSQLREYIKQRFLITKFWKRNYQVEVDPDDLEQWQEIEDNLGGFLDYKVQNIRELRKR